MKPRLEESDESYNRPYHTKRLLVDISGAPGDETIDYQTLLTWLCRSEDTLQSFLCALTVLEGDQHCLSLRYGVAESIMGVESGGGGRGTRPRSRKISRGRPPRNYDVSVFFLHTYANFALLNIFKMKWPKSEEKLNFWGRWVWVPINPSPPQKKNIWRRRA